MNRPGPFAIVALALGLTLGLSAEAHADADPASDVLVEQSVFLPLSAAVSPQVAARLRAVTRTAHASGRQIKVAVIASPTDLGGIPVLFGRPTDYARFLGAELQFFYTERLLVVMPQGAALAQRGRLVANADVVHAVIGSGADGLVRSAITLVRALTGETTRSRSSAGHPAGGVPMWMPALIAAGAGSALLLSGFLVRRRLRAAHRA
jgi:hypothetical protein